MAKRIRRLKGSGWWGESQRHSLASKGIGTGQKRKLRTPKLKRVRKLATFDTRLESLAGKDLTHERPGPGKFEGNYNVRFARAIHQEFGEGFGDDELGDVQDFGWYGKLDLSEYGIKQDGEPVFGVIAQEDNFGFFSYETYSNKKDFEESWAEIEHDYEDFSASVETGEE